MKKQFSALLSVLILGACSSEVDYTSFVNTKIGSGGHGHVFVGASVPFGMVQLGPTSIPQTWDWCSGYHSSDSTVIGFSHTHLSGTGCGDLYDITIMPVTGDNLTYARGVEEDGNSGLWSYADRSKEVSVPGYYSVPLERYGVLAEMTATCHVGMHRYTFPEGIDASIVIDLQNGGMDRTTESSIEYVDECTVRGYRYSQGWADNQKIFFYAKFSEPIAAFNQCGPDKLFARLDFASGNKLMMKVAISAVSEEGAQSNMEAELDGWDFEAVRADAKAAWNRELSKVSFRTADNDVRTTFYTALYHTMIVPSVFNDVDGKYRGADGQVHVPSEPHTVYTTFSLWDTYRAQMPLFSIIHPQKEADIMNTYIDICNEQGQMPVWHLHGCETYCMVGNPGVCSAADIFVKGFGGYDRKAAYDAMKTSAMEPGRGQNLRMEYGYIPCDLYNQSVANDMEYAIADWAMAQASAKMAAEETDDSLKAGYQADYEYFLNRSKSYKHFYDPQTGFMRGCDSRGVIEGDFNPFFSDHNRADYVEGNAWQYLWLVPHDLDGLTELLGGRDQMLHRLDELFTVSSKIDGENASMDMSGLIGQYVHGNEPSHHIIYFYTMAGQPWKTADKVRQVLSELYFAAEDGLSGNEDAGQMSAWYILSALGFYQVEPAGNRFWFGSPIMDEAVINLENGSFLIRAVNNSADNRYIQSITLNGEPYNLPYITYEDIMSGGELVLNMGSEQVCWWDVHQF